MAAQLTFDTLAFVKRLSAAGMEMRQAEALAEALSQHAFDDVATKLDLKELELRLTTRMGAMVGASTALTVAILGALISLH
ncbi:MAG TPA: hypothetical protein VGD66_12210 [Allosphingosinicella sp.]|jgi:hypothetical protein